MARLLAPFGLALVLAACGATGGRTLTLAEVQALNPGVSAAWLLQEYPGGSVVERWPDDAPRRIRYRVTDPSGRGQTLDLEFDRRGIATAKRYSGRILRPPPSGK